MDALFALLAIVMLCVFFVLKCRVPAGVAPLVAVCCVGPWLMLCGLAGLLLPGAVAGAGLCIALGLFACVYKRQGGWLARLASPATVFFVLASLCCIVYLWVRKPLVSEWDEVSLWATSVKLLKLNNHLYTTAEIGWDWNATQVPALPLLGYFFQLFGGYAEWKIYAGYDVLMLAVAAALIGTLSFKQYRLAVPLGIIGLLTPWFFTVYTRAIYVDNTWISSYGDIPAGLLYGGAVLVYLGLRREGARLWPVLPVLVTAALIKENTLVLALAAAGLIAADQLFFPPERAQSSAFGLRWLPKSKAAKPRQPGPAVRTMQRLWRAPVLRRLAFALVLVVAVFGFYRLWTGHVGSVLAADGSAPTNADPIAMVPVALAMLLGFSPQTEQFARALGDLVDAFLHTEIMMIPRITLGTEGEPGYIAIGTGVSVTLLIFALFLAAAFLTRDKRLRRRALTAMGLSTLCYLGYSFTMLVSYGFIFKPEQAERLDSYNRYFQPAYMGWFLIALGFVALAARDRENERPYGLATGGVLALCCAMLLRTTMLLQPQYTALGYPDAFYAEARQTQSRAGLVQRTVEADAHNALSTRIFFVSQGDNGEAWFTYSYELLPLLLDYSGDPDTGGGGGGTFGPPEHERAGRGYYLAYTPEALAEYIAGSGCGYVFVDALDSLFVDTYAGLFGDGLAEATAGKTLLYRVTTGAGGLQMVPVEMEVGA